VVVISGGNVDPNVLSGISDEAGCRGPRAPQLG
jgi:hypothetical protein